MDGDGTVWTVSSSTQLAGYDSGTGNLTRVCPPLVAGGGGLRRAGGGPGPVVARNGLVLVVQATGGISAIGH